MHKDFPLVWMKVIDEMKNSSDNCLTLQDVERICDRLSMSRQSIPYLLRFMHEMGLAMWHEESNLRMIIILNPIEYFVKPATTIICKHASENLIETSDVIHELPIHKECQKLFQDDRKMLITTGISSKRLTDALLTKNVYSSHIVELMKKYGLMFSFKSDKGELLPGINKEDDVDKFGKDEIKSDFYLVPSLLPHEHQYPQLEKTILKTSTPFYISFYSSILFTNENIFTFHQLRKEGFLPQGLYERLLTRMCLTSSDLSWRKGISKTSVVFNHNDHLFLLKNRMADNLFEVIVFGNNPIPVYLFLTKLIKQIREESYHSLKAEVLLPLSTSHSKEDDLLIRLEFVENCLEFNTFHKLHLTAVEKNLPLQPSKLKEQFNSWFYKYKLSLPLSFYDIFISYRRNDIDNLVVNSLFDQFTNYSIHRNSAKPQQNSASLVSVFLDSYRLEKAEDFQDGFAQALLNSRLYIPIITAECFKRLINHDSNSTDNLLIEWIIALGLYEISLIKDSGFKFNIYPIIYGSCEIEKKHHDGVIINSMKELGKVMIDDLQKSVLQLIQENQTIPNASMTNAVDKWNSYFRLKQYEFPKTILNLPISQIVSRLLRFNGDYFRDSVENFKSCFPIPLTTATEKYSSDIMKILYSLASASAEFPKIIKENDKFFYNIVEEKNDQSFIPSIPSLNKDNDLIVFDFNQKSLEMEMKDLPRFLTKLEHFLYTLDSLMSQHSLVMKFFRYRDLLEGDNFNEEFSALQTEMENFECHYENREEYKETWENYQKNYFNNTFSSSPSLLLEGVKQLARKQSKYAKYYQRLVQLQSKITDILKEISLPL